MANPIRTFPGGLVRPSEARISSVGTSVIARASWLLASLWRAGLAGRFHLTGLVAPDRIPAVMHASDVVVHCSLREGLARALPQAMLAGKPVISFDVDGAREVVDGQTGILLPPKDAAGLRRAIETLASSRELRDRLGAAGRRRCRDMFDHERMVERIERVYERIRHCPPAGGA